MCVCVRRHACQEFFLGEGAFGRCMCMHLHDMHILYECVHTR